MPVQGTREVLFSQAFIIWESGFGFGHFPELPMQAPDEVEFVLNSVEIESDSSGYSLIDYEDGKIYR